MIVRKRRPRSVVAASLAVVLFVGALFAAPVAPAARMAAEFNLEEATISDISAAFDAGALTCQRLAQLYVNRINTYDPNLHLIITVNPNLMAHPFGARRPRTASWGSALRPVSSAAPASRRRT
jgi:hypothetical protein